jgi:hypothetical protein
MYVHNIIYSILFQYYYSKYLCYLLEFNLYTLVYIKMFYIVYLMICYQVCKNESLLVYFSIKNKFYNNKKLKKQK